MSAFVTAYGGPLTVSTHLPSVERLRQHEPAASCCYHLSDPHRARQGCASGGRRHPGRPESCCMAASVASATLRPCARAARSSTWRTRRSARSSACARGAPSRSTCSRRTCSSWRSSTRTWPRPTPCSWASRWPSARSCATTSRASRRAFDLYLAVRAPRSPFTIHG